MTDTPIILHLSFLTRAGYEIVRIPEYLDKEVSIDNVNFDIIGATYGSGSHFKFRYYFNGKVYEADGMRKHSTSRPSKIVREAVSIEIKEPYESALAGHIGWILTSERIKVQGYKICEVFYMKR